MLGNYLLFDHKGNDQDFFNGGHTGSVANSNQSINKSQEYFQNINPI